MGTVNAQVQHTDMPPLQGPVSHAGSWQSCETLLLLACGKRKEGHSGERADTGHFLYSEDLQLLLMCST